MQQFKPPVRIPPRCGSNSASRWLAAALLGLAAMTLARSAHARSLPPVTGSAFVATPAAVDVGTVESNVRVTVPVTVRNNGGSTLRISGYSSWLGGCSASAGYSDSGWPVSVAPGASVIINVDILPGGRGSLRGQIRFYHNGLFGYTDVPVTGFGIGPVLEATPDSLDFGSSFVGFGVPQLGLITNVGETAATRILCRLLQDPDHCYSVGSDLSAITLAPGESVWLVVTFSPTRAGSLTGTLEILYAGGTWCHHEQLLMSLTGKGIDLPF